MSAEAKADHGNAEVRPCRSLDLPTISDILKETPQAAAWTQDGLRATLESYSAYCLTARQRKAIVGFIAGRRVADEAEILNLAVRSPARRLGVGRHLVEALLNVFQREGVIRVFLEVRESNTEAVAFYQRLGFLQVGKRLDYYHEPDESALVLALDVSHVTTG